MASAFRPPAPKHNCFFWIDNPGLRLAIWVSYLGDSNGSQRKDQLSYYNYIGSHCEKSGYFLKDELAKTNKEKAQMDIGVPGVLVSKLAKKVHQALANESVDSFGLEDVQHGILRGIFNEMADIIYKDDLLDIWRDPEAFVRCWDRGDMKKHFDSSTPLKKDHFPRGHWLNVPNARKFTIDKGPRFQISELDQYPIIVREMD
ncbi:hypothetical protein MMC19_005735 [Ptychographa xylographoides]|nr:hypothetical protein [Ptychographa xylographoides]